MNRIITKIAKIEENLKSKSAEEIKKARKAMDMSFEEYVRFQELKSLASMDGTLTFEEAQTIYGYLGNTPDHFNKQSLAIKYVLTRCFSELIGKRIVDKKK